MLNPTALRSLCRAVLAEDVGAGDATSLAMIPEHLETEAAMVTREACICAGLPVAEAIFAELDASVHFTALAREGEACAAGRHLATVAGKARAILTGERTALNFVQRLAGIATLTNRFVKAVGEHKTKILDTRKTTPGLRALEKYAVRIGGGQNHRFGLYDRIMIKDNHRALAAFQGPEPIPWAVKMCRKAYPKLEIEVEADDMDQVEAAATAGADYILLDNMTDEETAEAVRIVRGRSRTEASGGITLERVAALAGIGVDFISVGALTHSVRSIDIGLDIATPQ